MRSPFLACLSILLPVVLSAPQPACGEQITIEPIKHYGYPLPYRVAELSEYGNNLTTAWQADFDQCMAAAQGQMYWHCQKYWFEGAVPSDNNAGFTNGIAYEYKLFLGRLVDTSNYDGHFVYTETREGASRTGWQCPEGYAFTTQGPTENRKAWCQKVEVLSCPAGNPIDVMSGRKFEYKIDYLSPNGVLKVARQYVDQNSGWRVNAEPRILHVDSGSSVTSAGAFQHTRADCIAPYEQTLTRLKATPEEPFIQETYTKLVCPEFVNREPVPVIYAWFNGREVRFVENNGVFLPEGGFAGRLSIESVSDPAVPDAAWKLTYDDGGISYFNSDGTILKTFPAAGGTLDYQYIDGQLVSKSDQSGRSLGYVYNSSERLESITLPDGGAIQYTYVSDSDENDVNYWLIDSVTWPDGATESYAYNESAHILGTGGDTFLTGKLDAYGNRTGTYSYSIGKANATEGFGGANKVEVTYRGYNYARVKDGLDTQRTLYFNTQLADGRRLLTQRYQPAGAGSAAGNEYRYYNGDGQVTEQRDYNGNKTQYAYDPVLKFETVRVEGIPASQWGTYTADGVALPAGAFKTSTDWEASISQPRRVAAPGIITTYVYQGLPDPFNNNAIADCTAATLGQGPLPVVCRKVEQATTDNTGQQGFNAPLDVTLDARQVLYTYNANGDLLTVQRSPTFATELSLTYYTDATATHKPGDLASTTNALGQTLDYLEYDANGNATRLRDANGAEVLRSYDARGRLLSQTSAGRTTAFGYDLNGRLTSVTTPDGVTVTREYDGAGRLAALVDAAANRTAFTYDLEGNRLSETIQNAGSQTLYSVSHQYDALGRLQTTLGNNGQITDRTYDKKGNPLTDTDALARTNTTQVDAHDRVDQVTDAASGQTQYAYDAAGRVTSVTDAEGKVTQYTYDAFGNLTTLTSEDSGVTTFTYDANGRVLTKTDARGVTATYSYDALDRLTGLSYADPAANVSYSYDDTAGGNPGIGHLTGITDPSGSTQYTYNAAGDVTRQTQVIDGYTYVTDYLYDANGRATGVVYPSGLTLSYSYDALGQLSGIDTTLGGQPRTLASAIAYLPFGPVESLTFGNGLVLTHSYDLDYRRTGTTLTGQQQTTYSYSLVDTITAIDDVFAAAFNQTFTYDALDRLDVATGTYGSVDYAYDAVGNRLSENTDNYSYANHAQLQSIAGTQPVSFAYDAAGNTLQKDGLTFTYNPANRLATATDGVFSASYTYNARGERVIKVVDGVETHSIFDLDGKLIAEADATGAIQREYVYFDDAPLALIVGSDVYFYHNSHLGTPESVTDATQNTVWRAHYAPFGEATVTTASVENNLRFPGQYYDQETGLHYNYFRYYDPGTGRYLTSDPIGLQGGPNTYEYALNNPVRVYDPFGLEPNQGCVAACTAGGSLLGGGLGYLGGGLLGGAGGTLALPGGGTIAGGISGAQLGGAAGATAGGTAGNALGRAFCPDDDEDECDLEFVREVNYGGDTKSCVYKGKGNMFTFPQDKELPCMPIDRKRCLVDTSFMGPKARRAYGGG